jgi:hypothetical protein
MFRAHSLLWHYLWVAPNVLLLTLGFLIWRRKLVRQIPAFFAFAILSGLSELAVYAADVIPSVNPYAYWQVNWAALVIESVLKLALIGEIFALVFGSYTSVAKLGTVLIRSLGAILVLAGTALAAFAPPDGRFGIISGVHLSELAVHLVISGLLLFIFLFAAYFRLSWQRRQIGVALGLGISSCVHLATLAFTNSGVNASTRMLLVFLNMTTYHAVVLMWFYYLLVPAKENAKHLKPLVPLPENNLEVWNRELERLIQQ